MVKGYDPTKNDPSALLINYVFELWNSNPTLTLNQSQKYVSNWIQTSEYTSKVYAAFREVNLKPRIRIVKKCSLSRGKFKDGPDEYFPTTSTDTEITLCLDNIRNKLELKENLDREMTLLYRRTAHKSEGLSQEGKEKQLMEDVYASCYEGYRNYMMDPKLTKEMSLICSKYMFFRKSKSSLPIDRLFRYTTKLTEDLLL